MLIAVGNVYRNVSTGKLVRVTIKDFLAVSFAVVGDNLKSVIPPVYGWAYLTDFHEEYMPVETKEEPFEATP